MFNQNYEFLYYRNFVFMTPPEVPRPPTVESIKKTKTSIASALKLDMRSFVKYGDAQNFQKYLETKFKVSTDEAKIKIMSSKSVKDSLGSFLSTARKSIPSIMARLKAIRPKAKESPRNLIKMRSRLESIRKDMNARLQVLRSQTKQLDKRIQGEKNRIGCDMIWTAQKSRKIVCSPAKFRPHKYVVDLSQRKNFHKKVESALSAPAEKMMSPKEFRKMLEKEIKSFEESGNYRVEMMSTLDLSVVNILSEQFAKGEITKKEFEAYVSGLRGTDYYKNVMRSLKGMNSELGDSTIYSMYPTSVQAGKTFEAGLKQSLSKLKESFRLKQISDAIDQGLEDHLEGITNKKGYTLRYKNSVWLKYLKQTDQYKKFLKSVKSVEAVPEGVKKLFPVLEQIVEQNNHPPSIASCKYKDGKINIVGKGVGKLHLDSFKFRPNININTGSTVAKVGGLNVSAFNLKETLRAQLEGPFRESLSTHINQNQFTKRLSRNITEKIISAMDLNQIAENMIMKSFKMKIVGVASADGNFNYNKDLAQKRAEKARDKFIGRNKLPKTFAKNIQIESHVEGPDGNEVKSQAEAGKVFSKLKEIWNNRGNSGKKVTEGQMRQYLSFYNRNQKNKLPQGMYDFIADKIGKKRGVQYLSKYDSSDSAISFSSQELMTQS